jgi:hypothetical protein
VLNLGNSRFVFESSTVVGCSRNAMALEKSAIHCYPDQGKVRFDDLNCTACFSSNGTAAFGIGLGGWDGEYMRRVTVSGCLDRDVMRFSCDNNNVSLSYSYLYRNTVVRGSVPPNGVPWSPDNNPYQYGVLVSATEGFMIDRCVFLGSDFHERQTGYALHDVLPILNGSTLPSFGGPFLISDSYLTYNNSFGATYFSVTRPVQEAPTMPILPKVCPAPSAIF